MEKPILKPLNYDDSNLMYSVYNDAKIQLYAILNSSYPCSDLYIENKLKECLSNKAQRHYKIIHDSSNVGIAQIFNIDNVNRKCKLGILILSEHHNQKIGSYTLESLISICFDDLNLNKIEVDVIEHNKQSQRLFEKQNFIKEGESRNAIYKKSKYFNLYQYGLLRSEYYINE